MAVANKRSTKYIVGSAFTEVTQVLQAAYADVKALEDEIERISKQHENGEMWVLLTSWIRPDGDVDIGNLEMAASLLSLVPEINRNFKTLLRRPEYHIQPRFKIVLLSELDEAIEAERKEREDELNSSKQG